MSNSISRLHHSNPETEGASKACSVDITYKDCVGKHLSMTWETTRVPIYFLINNWVSNKWQSTFTCNKYQFHWVMSPSHLRLFISSLAVCGSEKAMAPHSSTLAWKIPWTEEPGRLQSMGSLRVGHDWETSPSLFTSCIGEGSGNPLQYSCLDNPRDRGAWWAAVYRVA